MSGFKKNPIALKSKNSLSSSFFYIYFKKEKNKLLSGKSVHFLLFFGIFSSRLEAKGRFQRKRKEKQRKDREMHGIILRGGKILVSSLQRRIQI